MENEHDLNLRFATTKPMIIFEQILLYIRLGDVGAKTTFNAEETLTVNEFIGANFMDTFFTSIYPTERKLSLLRSKTIYSLSAGALHKLVRATRSSQGEQRLYKSDCICDSKTKCTTILRVTKQNSMKPNGMQKVLAVASGRVVVYFERYEQFARPSLAIYAKE